MKDGRSPRIHLFLTIWTLLLIGLVLVEIRHLPPGLTVLLVPYLALMARHWVGRLRQPGHIEPAMPREEAAGSPSDDEPDDFADPLGSDGCSISDDSPRPTLPRPTEEPSPPPLQRSRSRRRPRAPEVEPSAASWVQIGPGRFIRVEQKVPEHPAAESDGNDCPDEPQWAMSHDGVDRAPEADPISTDANAVIPEPEARYVLRDSTHAMIPERPGDGSAEPDLPPEGRSGDGSGNDSWNGSWIVRLPQCDPDS
jgi:hypothetical protein